MLYLSYMNYIYIIGNVCVEMRLLSLYVNNYVTCLGWHVEPVHSLKY